MKRKMKRLTSLLLALIMALSLFPAAVFAAPEDAPKAEGAKSGYSFVTQPTCSGTLVPGGEVRGSWETNQVPDRIVIRNWYYEYYYVNEPVAEITTNLLSDMGYNLKAEVKS